MGCAFVTQHSATEVEWVVFVWYDICLLRPLATYLGSIAVCAWVRDSRNYDTVDFGSNGDGGGSNPGKALPSKTLHQPTDFDEDDVALVRFGATIYRSLFQSSSHAAAAGLLSMVELQQRQGFWKDTLLLAKVRYYHDSGMKRVT